MMLELNETFEDFRDPKSEKDLKKEGKKCSIQ